MEAARRRGCRVLERLADPALDLGADALAGLERLALLLLELLAAIAGVLFRLALHQIRERIVLCRVLASTGADVDRGRDAIHRIVDRARRILDAAAHARARRGLRDVVDVRHRIVDRPQRIATGGLKAHEVEVLATTATTAAATIVVRRLLEQHARQTTDAP